MSGKQLYFSKQTQGLTYAGGGEAQVPVRLTGRGVPLLFCCFLEKHGCGGLQSPGLVSPRACSCGHVRGGGAGAHWRAWALPRACLPVIEGSGVWVCSPVAACLPRLCQDMALGDSPLWRQAPAGLAPASVDT